MRGLDSLIQKLETTTDPLSLYELFCDLELDDLVYTDPHYRDGRWYWFVNNIDQIVAETFRECISKGLIALIQNMDVDDQGAEYAKEGKHY